MFALGAALLLSLTTAQTAPQRSPPTVPLRSTERMPSLLSGDSLGAGGSALTATAGYPWVGIAWAQGLTSTLDAGVAADLDLALTELAAGPTVRWTFFRRGALSVAARARLAYFANLGADWALSRNDSNQGLQLAPGLAASTVTSRGAILSAGLDLPVTATWNGAGTILSPRLTAALESPWYGDLSIGVRAGVGVRTANGGAPLATRDDRVGVELGAAITYRIF